MKKLLGAILIVAATCVNIWGQHLSEFNRLFVDPSADSGRMAVTVSFAAYIVQSSQAQGFGNLSITSHFFLNENMEFRLGGGFGVNDNSYHETDINVARLVTPANYETYSGWLGLNRQFASTRT